MHAACPSHQIATCISAKLSFWYQKYQLFLGSFQSESTLSDGSILLLLKPPTTVFLRWSVTDDPPPLNASFRFSVAPVPVPVILAAEQVPYPHILWHELQLLWWYMKQPNTLSQSHHRQSYHIRVPPTKVRAMVQTNLVNLFPNVFLTLTGDQK